MKDLKNGMNVVKFSDVRDVLATTYQQKQDVERYVKDINLAYSINTAKSAVKLTVALIDDILEVLEGARSFTCMNDFHCVLFSVTDGKIKESEKSHTMFNFRETPIYIEYIGEKTINEANEIIMNQLHEKSFSPLKKVELLRPYTDNKKSITHIVKKTGLVVGKLQTSYRFLILEKNLIKDSTIMNYAQSLINDMYKLKDDLQALKELVGRLEYNEDKEKYFLPVDEEVNNDDNNGFLLILKELDNEKSSVKLQWLIDSIEENELRTKDEVKKWLK